MRVQLPTQQKQKTIMKPKPGKHIDRLLGELGLPPDAVDPERIAEEFDPSPSKRNIPTTGKCGKSCYPSEVKARKAANRIKSHGANTSFLRPYFCPTCKAWHMTSSRNVAAKDSSVPKRNAGHHRRNQERPSDEI